MMWSIIVESKLVLIQQTPQQLTAPMSCSLAALKHPVVWSG